MARTNYGDAGYNQFFSRSIGAVSATTLGQQSSDFNKGNNREINYDASQTSGSLGSKLPVGSVIIDGVVGKISVFEGTDEVVKIGELDA